jgi:hypothetical protein
MKDKKIDIGAKIALKKAGLWSFYVRVLGAVFLSIYGLTFGIYFFKNASGDKLQFVFDYGLNILAFEIFQDPKFQRASSEALGELGSYLILAESANRYALIAASLGLLASVAIFYKFAKKSQTDQLLRGPKLVSAEALSRKLKTCARRGFGDGYQIGKLQVPEEYLYRSFAIVGRPGTGKSTLIKQLLRQDA